MGTGIQFPLKETKSKRLYEPLPYKQSCPWQDVGASGGAEGLGAGDVGL